MITEIPKQLLIIKDLFLHREQHAFFDSKLDRRLAIISFHNSIELFLRYTLNTKSTSNDELDKMKFENKIQEFENKLLQGNTNVPYRSKIIDLNDLRNKIYHDYRIPTNEETEEFKVITKLFLKDLIKEIFDLEFDDISSFDSNTIRNPFVKDFYLYGKKCFEEAKYECSMSQYQKAFNEQWNSYYGPSINIRTRSIPKNSSVLDDIVQVVDELAIETNYGFEILKTAIAKKNHLGSKKWVDAVYHGFANEDVNLEDIIKMKKLVEEFISETDDYILEEYLRHRLYDYEQKMASEDWF